MAKRALTVLIIWALVSCSGGGGTSETDESDSQTVQAVQEESTGGLHWPVDCEIGVTCGAWVGFPDIDGDNLAFNCDYPGYQWHTGTDIFNATGRTDMAILAAAPGQVLFVSDGKYDRCEGESSTHPDCLPPTVAAAPFVNSGYLSCSGLLPELCPPEEAQSCFVCAGGNWVLVRHDGLPGVLATLYVHMKNGSPAVAPGQWVEAGQKLGEMGASGVTYTEHLHFEVWGSGIYDSVDPWAGRCGPNTSLSLWAPGVEERVLETFSW